MTKVYCAMQKVINRLQDEDGRFDAEAMFIIGVLGQHLDISQEELLILANKEVKLVVTLKGAHKIKVIKILRSHIKDGKEAISLLIGKDISEGQPVAVSRDIATKIKKECTELGACVEFH